MPADVAGDVAVVAEVDAQTRGTPSTGAGLDAAALDAPPQGHAWRWWVLSSTSLAVLLASLNTSTLVIALPALIRELHTGVLTATWVLLGYMLAQTACVLTAGRLGDLFGRRRLFIAGLAGFTLSALASGFAPDAGTLIVLRVVAGGCGAFVLATSGAIVTDAFGRRQLGFALGINSTVVACGSAFGPVLGGWLVGFGWRWVFWFNVPLGALGALWAVAVLREPARRSGRPAIDWIGNALFVVAMTGLLLALSMGGVEGWNQPVVYAGIVALVVGLPLFILRELHTESPLLDLRLFRSRLFAVANLTQLVSGTARIGLLFLLVFYFQGAQGRDAVVAGVLTIPLAAAIIVVSPLSGFVSDRVGSVLPSSVGLALTGLGLAGLGVRIALDTPYWELATWMAVIGAGSGIFQSPNAGAIMGSVAPHQRGVASGVRMLGAFSGVMISIAFVLAIVTSSLPHDVTLRIFSGVTAGLASSQIGSFISAVRVALLVLGLLSLACVPVSLMRSDRRPVSTATA